MRMGARSALISRVFPLAEYPKTTAAGGCPIRNRTWNAQLHFCSRSDFAPHVELRTHLLGALAHSGQTPVSITSRVHELRVDALSIIPDTQPKKTFAIRDVRFDSP